ncbi:hypothetical protein JJD41_08870 [Oxynema sp. CENA135]|uniref:hypothetical protein n=1 Tax=Oxynema sp. CENA135 TaxID=984206 RepID=UPI00190E10A7|nr:hypothetical protein [Oxynema sp. CENA135]MBK4729974.1 hypothetical protein [Oxynema sp. CENA135]
MPSFLVDRDNKSPQQQRSPPQKEAIENRAIAATEGQSKARNSPLQTQPGFLERVK